MALITKRDLEVAHNCVVRSIASNPDAWNGVHAGALPDLVMQVAIEVTSERQRVIRVIQESGSHRGTLDAEVFRELKRPAGG